MSTATLRNRTPSPKSTPKVLVNGVDTDKRRITPNGTQTELHQQGKPFVVPTYTVKELLDAIPPHCFKRSALKSTRYVLQDVAIVAVLATGAMHIPALLDHLALPPVPTLALRIILWNAYWFFTGCVGMGLWVLAHEAGHMAFSENKAFNDVVGLVLHSIWLVPYHSWRISHGRHHAACGHHGKDEVFVARTRSQLGLPALDLEKEDILGLEVTEERQEEMHSAIAEAVGDAPIVVFAHLVFHQIFGLPAYLIMNASGQLHYAPDWVDHFRPSSKIFKSRDFWDIIVSDIGIATVLTTMTLWARARGWQEMVCMWLIPYLWVNQWLVLITFLQHTDPIIPHYTAKTWTFPRGALTTVDRNILGWIGPYLMHGISETHVAHHISSRIPHYNAWEATTALQNFLGESYHCSNENVFVSLWKNFRSCQFVEDTGDILFYKNKEGQAATYPVFAEKEGGVSDSGVDVEDPVEEFYPRKGD